MYMFLEFRNKGRLEEHTRNTQEKLKKFEFEITNNGNLIGELRRLDAISAQDRLDLRRQIERLDAEKASKDVVESFRQEIGTLRNDMDKRFDRIEQLIVTKLTQ